MLHREIMDCVLQHIRNRKMLCLGKCMMFLLTLKGIVVNLYTTRFCIKKILHSTHRIHLCFFVRISE
jgi:hypothetical protein